MTTVRAAMRIGAVMTMMVVMVVVMIAGVGICTWAIIMMVLLPKNIMSVYRSAGGQINICTSVTDQATEDKSASYDSSQDI